MKFLFPLSLVAYTVGIVLSILATSKRSSAARVGATVSYAIACVLQAAGILTFALRVGHVPLTNKFEYLLTLGWLVLVLYLIAQLRWNIQAAGLLLGPIAFLITVYAIVRLPAAESGGPLLERVDIFLFHTTLATLGMAAFFVAAAMSVVYLLQDRALKQKRTLKWLDRLPPLDQADRAGLEAMLWGFPLFTLGIITGVGLTMSAHQQFWIGGAKGVFPILAWIIFAGVLLARLTRGFRGRKAAYLTMMGFLLGLLTIMGIPR